MCLAAVFMSYCVMMCVVLCVCSCSSLCLMCLCGLLAIHCVMSYGLCCRVSVVMRACMLLSFVFGCV